MRGVDSTGLLWSGGAQSDPGLVLAWAGDAVLMAFDQRTRPWQVRWHIDPERSRLYQHPAFPILVSELLATRLRHRPGSAKSWYLRNQSLTAQLPLGSGQAILTAPSGVERNLLANRHAMVGPVRLNEEGDWTLASGEQRWQVRVLAPDPQQLVGQQPLWEDRFPTASGEVDLPREREPLAFVLPLLLTLLCACGAWWAFMREQGER